MHIRRGARARGRGGRGTCGTRERGTALEIYPHRYKKKCTDEIQRKKENVYYQETKLLYILFAKQFFCA